MTTTRFAVGARYYQAQIFRFGRGLDYDCPPRATQAEVEADLADALGMMTAREREQSESESFVGRYRVAAVGQDGAISCGVSC